MVRFSSAIVVTLLCLIAAGCGDGRPATSQSVDAGMDGAIDLPASDVPTQPEVVDALVAPADAPVDGPALDACISPRTACGSGCVDLQSDPSHCGSCERNCTVLHGVSGSQARCVAGRCDLTDACLEGTADCDRDPTNGCEASLSVAASCGGCSVTCSGATPMCTATSTGDGGLARRCSNGCSSATPTRCGTACVDTDTDLMSCGGCDQRCVAPVNGTVACVAGACRIRCGSGFHLCGTLCADDGSPSTCGSSCSPCGAPPANAATTCIAGVCDFTCLAGFHRCGDRCVTNTSPASCGASCSPCEEPTNGRATCDGTACGVACNVGFHLCGGACVSNMSVNSCGASCSACAPTPNGTPTCDGFSCGVSCVSGHHACAGACVASTSPASCGSSCTPCVAPTNATATCSGGTCGFECLPGYPLGGGVCQPPPSCPSPAERGCGLVLVSGSTFTLGQAGVPRAEPVVPGITVSSFVIDAYEVTVARFRRYWSAGHPGVAGGVVAYPQGTSLPWTGAVAEPTRSSADATCDWSPSPSTGEDRPLNCVNWYTAQAFCVWDGGRLPTDAEWEFAARTAAGFSYPWGEATPFGQLCWSGGGTMRTGPCRVGDFPATRGLYDMAGNLTEWMADLNATYGTRCWSGDFRHLDPLCLDGSFRQIRGGAWRDTLPERELAADRAFFTDAQWNIGIGFRCVRTP